MAWGSSQEPSTFSKVFPLAVVIVLLCVAGYVCYQIYLSAQQIGNTASERMNKKNVVWTKDGLKVGVKHIQNETYVDKTQSLVVKAWNLGKDGARASGSNKKD